VFQTAHPPPVQQTAPAPANPIQLAMVQTQAPPPQTPPAAAAQATAQATAQAEEAASRQAHAAELARRAALAQAALDKQKQAQLQAQDLRRKAQLAKAEAQAEDRAKQEAEAARVAQAQLAAAAQARAAQLAAAAKPAPAPVKVATVQPPAPKGPTRGFSATPISGGAPSYPSAYESDGRVGRVTVSCLITSSGSPSGCHVVSSQGGIGFNNAALSWLHSGEVRYAPILRDGEPRSEEHSWSISFQP
jgi:TonB family protein